MTREEMYAKLDALYTHIDETKAKAEQAKTESREKVESDLAEVRERVSAAKESMRITTEQGKGKLNSELLKLQINLEEARRAREAARAEHSREVALRAVEQVENYAADAVSLAVMAVDEAASATLEAVDARLAYEEKYGKDK